MIESLIVWLVIVFGAFWWVIGVYWLVRNLFTRRERDPDDPEDRDSYGPFRK